MSINFFSKNEENKFSIFANVYTKYSKEIVYDQIKEIYIYNKEHDKKNSENKIDTLRKPKFSVYKLKNMYVEKLKNMTNLLKLDEGEGANTKYEESKDNKYASVVEKLFKKRQEDESKEKEFADKCSYLMNMYEKECLFNFISEVTLDPKIAQRIYKEKGDLMRQTVEFEKEVLDYFLSESNKKQEYTKINNKDFELYAKIEKDNKGLTILFEKEIEINIVHLLSLIYEVEFYTKWFPFCTASNCTLQTGKAKKICHMVSSFPVISNRDFLIYGFGVNRLKENNTMLILCKSILEDNKVFQDQFLKNANKKYVRGDINIFGFEMKVINKNKVLLKGLNNIDPKLDFIPQWLVNKISQQVIIYEYNLGEFLDEFIIF